MPSIELQDLHFSFPNARLFEGVSASFEGPAVISLLGASGSGKTTLLRLIAGVLVPQAGTVLRRPDGAGRLAWVPQDGGLFPWLTVQRNIKFPSTLTSNTVASGRQAGQRAERIMADLGIATCRDKYPAEISGGQKQRTAVGRALMAQSKVLLMDEPFSALDPQTRADVRSLVRRTTYENGMLTIVVTHDLLDAAFIGDRALIISIARPARLEEVPVPANPAPTERGLADATQVASRLGAALTMSAVNRIEKTD